MHISVIDNISNRFLIRREGGNVLPAHLRVSDLKPFNFIVCQSVHNETTYDAMIVAHGNQVGPNLVEAITREGEKILVAFSEILDVTHRARMEEDGVEDVFPIETVRVAAASPATLLSMMHEETYPRVLMYDGENDSWELKSLSPSHAGMPIPGETVHAVMTSDQVFVTQIMIGAFGPVRGVVSRQCSNIGECINWTASSLRNFLMEDPKNRLIEISYQYSEADIVFLTNQGIEVRWPVDLDEAMELKHSEDFVVTDVKETDAPPRYVVAHIAHPCMDFAIEFRRVQIKIPAIAKEDKPKKPKAAKKTVLKSAKKAKPKTMSKADRLKSSAKKRSKAYEAKPY